MRHCKDLVRKTLHLLLESPTGKAERSLCSYTRVTFFSLPSTFASLSSSPSLLLHSHRMPSQAHSEAAAVHSW
uniref:Uncharacterized protein n=1 Tax=Oryza brachyantha TaxID=4533 RepID=J3M217_ORYBR